MEDIFFDNYPIPDYLLRDNSFDDMTDEELREYFLDSEADDVIEEQKSNPYPYYEP